MKTEQNMYKKQGQKEIVWMWSSGMDACFRHWKNKLLYSGNVAFWPLLF